MMRRPTHEESAALHAQLLAKVGRVVEKAQLPRTPPSRCGYLPDRDHRLQAFSAEALRPGTYHALMDLGFRRSGEIFYRTACEACTECRPIRVRSFDFKPNRSQRRCAAKNQDITMSVDIPTPSPEKFDLYCRYLNARHREGQMKADLHEFTDFLYSTRVRSREVEYRLGERLIGVGIFDDEPRAISTVYCYYDPDLKERGLGTYNVLRMIEHAREMQRPYVYLGFYIRDCAKMRYKIAFQPCEIQQADGQWYPFVGL